MTRTPLPSNKEAEKALLGYILLTNRIPGEVRQVLRPEHFHQRDHVDIYSAMLCVAKDGASIDQVTIFTYMSEHRERYGKALDRGIVADIASLAGEAVGNEPFVRYTEIVLENYRRRRIYLASSKARDMSIDMSVDPEFTIETYRKGMTEANKPLLGLKNKDSFVRPEDILKRRLKGISFRDTVSRIPLGYPVLDNRIVLGQVPRQVSIIAGRPGMGKSTLRENIICRQADMGLRILNIPLEEGFDTEMDRLDAIKLQIPLTQVMASYEWSGITDPRYKRILMENWRRTRNWQVFTLDDPDTTTESIFEYAREMKETIGLDIIYIDLFDRLQDVGQKPAEITEAIRRVSYIAKILNVHICLIVQISREVPKNKRNGIPTIEDLKGSGGFEEHARLIQLVWRPAVYIENADSDQIISIIGKQNNGPSGNHIKAPLVFIEDTVTILDPSEAPSGFTNGPRPSRKGENGVANEYTNSGSRSVVGKEEEVIPQKEQDDLFRGGSKPIGFKGKRWR